MKRGPKGVAGHFVRHTELFKAALALGPKATLKVVDLRD
jgi:hypothetical protein